MNLEFVSDPTPSMPHGSAVAAAVDACAVGQSVQPVEDPGPGEPKFTVQCMQASRLNVDLFFRVRAIPFDTSFVRVYLTQALAESNPGGSALVASKTDDVGNITVDPWDFQLVNGPAGPDLDEWHVAIVPINATPQNPLDSVYKLAATASQQAVTTDFLQGENSVEVTDLTHNTKFRAIVDQPVAKWRDTLGTKPVITAQAVDVPEDTVALEIDETVYTIVHRAQSTDASWLALTLEPQQSSEVL